MLIRNVTALASPETGGWWELAPDDGRERKRYQRITLPTFMLPRDTKLRDQVYLERIGGALGFWRVVSIHRPLNSNYGRRHLR
jgi:hypothetical protein